MKKLRLAISSALIILTTLVIPANTFTAAATTPPNLWARTYGGAQTEDARSAKQTSDGGFIVAGTTNSFGAGGFDMWVVRLDSLGHVVWQRTYGGTGNDFALSVDQTPDGGFIVAGNTASFGAGSYDAWVLRLDAMGLV